MVRHRATLTQRNKPFKGDSKRKARLNAAKKDQRGGASPSGPGKGADRKARLHALKQSRDNKIQEAKLRERMDAAAGEHVPPKVVVLVAFHDASDLAAVRQNLCAMAVSGGGKACSSPAQPCSMVSLPKKFAAGGQHRRFVVVEAPRELHAVLDAVKTADIVVAVFRQASFENSAFDEEGYRILSALKQQGLPTVIGVAAGLDQICCKSGSDSGLTAKQIAEAKKFAHRYFVSEFGEDRKFFTLDVESDYLKLGRALAVAVPKQISWREGHSYVAAYDWEYDAEKQTLALDGYVRGPEGFSTRFPVHLTGHGDFCLEAICRRPDPFDNLEASAHHAIDEIKHPALADFPELKKGFVLERVDDEAEESLREEMEQLQPFDPLANEQTWPTEEELADAEDIRAVQPKKTRQKVQRIGAADEEKSDEDSDEDIEDIDSIADDDDDDDDARSVHGGSEHWNASSRRDTSGAVTLASELVPYKTPQQMEEHKMQLRHIEMVDRSPEDMDFPDEVDVPTDTLAKVRFQKYRGLQSFRTSPWHPYEDLPVEYSRIFSFDDFQGTMKVARKKFAAACAEVGSLPTSQVSHLPQLHGTAGRFCRFILRQVPPSIVESHPTGAPWILSSLLPFERKVTVMHFLLHRAIRTAAASTVAEEPEDPMAADGEAAAANAGPPPLRSKTVCEIHAGFRRFMARPVFSSVPTKHNSKSEKVKFARSLGNGETAVASVYCQTIAPPASVLLITREAETGKAQVEAWGSVVGTNTNRLIIKRIVLTGYPFKASKKKAIVRYMFYNPIDIRWFKPVELHSKKKLRGHIKEPLGTHGYTKCQFSDKVDQSDVICMYLYKRVYPKWYPPSWGGNEEDGPESQITSTRPA